MSASVTVELVEGADVLERLASLLALAESDVDVVIAEGGVPRARLVAIPPNEPPPEAPKPAAKRPRIPGLGIGSMWVSDDFDQPLPDEFWLGTDA